MRDRCVLAILALAIPASAAAGDVKDLFPSLVQQVPTQLQPIVTINGGSNPGTFLGQDSVDGIFDSKFEPRQPVVADREPIPALPGRLGGSRVDVPVRPRAERVCALTEGLGPLQSDRAQTTGKGKIDVSFAYSRRRVRRVRGREPRRDRPRVCGRGSGRVESDSSFIFNNGDSFMNFSLDLPLGPGQQLPFIDSGNGIISAPGINGSHANPDASPAPFANGSVSVASVRSILDAELDVDAFAFFLNYGITDWLDAGILVPLLNVEGSGRVTTFGISGAPNGAVATSKQEQDSFGFGDLILRSKARVLTSEFVDVAVRGDLTLPTGDEDDFRGYGDPGFGGTLILSKTFWIISPHANAGLYFRTDDPDMHTFRWAVGLDAPLLSQTIGDPLEFLTLTADVVGEHLIRDEEDVGEDIVGIAGGLKLNPWRELVLSGSALARLNSDGLRADVIPSFSVEYTFR